MHRVCAAFNSNMYLHMEPLLPLDLATIKILCSYYMHTVGKPADGLA
jgi:hypothetical protein